jgi:PAS domain S-box-containing protein
LIDRTKTGGSPRAAGPAEDSVTIRAAQRTLTLDAERRRAVAAAAASILWSADVAGQVLDMAPQWHTFTGQSEAQFRGDGWLDAVHPDDRALAAQTWARALRDQAPADAQYRLRHVSGEYRFIAVRYVPVFDPGGRLREWVGWMADIDARVRAEHERDRFFTVSLDLLCVVDIDGRFKRVNPAFERTLGFTPEELCSAPFFDFVHPEDRVATLAQFEKLKQGAPLTYFENRYQCRDGNHRWLAWSAFPEVDEGLIYAAARDVTERKEAQEQLKAQAAKLAEADRRKDEFIAMLAHELRNPLSPIRSAVDVLRRTGDPERLGWATDVIDRQLTQLTRLVDDLLDVARLTRGRIKLNKAPVDLREIVDEAVETVRPTIEQRRHALRATLPNAALRIEADRLRLAQVFINLLDNAAKYTQDGGQIELRVSIIENGRAVVRVQDSGIGIAAHVAPKLFDAFGQAERSLARAEGGLGLGLTLAKRLTEMHHGSIAVESAGLGLGSTFSVTLPLMEREPALDQGRETLQERSGEALRVLVVDDNPAVAEGLEMLIELLGHEVRTAPDGPAALQKAQAFKPQVALLDIGLPGMDGCELAQALRADSGEALLLIALTGYGDELTRERVRQAGFDHHFLKPCESDALEALLAAYAADRREDSEQRKRGR